MEISRARRPGSSYNFVVAAVASWLEIFSVRPEKTENKTLLSQHFR
jgi:hypothetical protein